MAVFFASVVLIIQVIDDIPGAAAVGSAISLACAIAVLARIRSGRAGPASARAVAIFFIIPVFLFGASLRIESVRTCSSLKESLKNLNTLTECTFRGIITDISPDDGKMICYMKNAHVDIWQGSVRVSYEEKDGAELKVGDTAEGTGKIRAPQKASNPGCFDEDAYYTVRGIDGLITATALEKCAEESNMGVVLGIKRILTDLRINTVGALTESLDTKEAAVLAAVLTGERGLIDEETKESLAAGGIAHILAVSGLHISLIANGIYRFLMMLCGRRKLSSFITMLFLLLYGIFTGMPVSAARAIIMSTCMLTARMISRTYDMVSAISLAGLVILFVNPLYISDSSFIMSFCAAGGAAYGREIICGARVRNKRLMGVLTVGGIYLFMIPVLINTYYYVTPYSLLINFAVIPVMSLLVPCGGICILFTALFGSGIAKFAGGICHYIVKGMTALCDISDKMPFSKVITGHREPEIVIFYYAVLVVTLVLVMTFRRKLPLWALTACLIIFVRIHADGTVIHMLDVGQGECIVIEDGGENIIVDAGSSNVKKLYRYRIGPFLKYMGIGRVEYMILTHSDSDHKNGMKDLLADTDLKVNRFVCSDTGNSGSETASFSHEPCEIMRVAAGDEIELESGSRLRVLSPQREAAAADPAKDAYEADGKFTAKVDENDNSIVFEFCGENMTALFTGDSSSKAEGDYIGKLSGNRIDVLKVAHHGSKYSTSQLLVDKTEPLVGIVSASSTNRYGHPSKETLQRLDGAGCTVFTTPRNGYIRVECDRERIGVATSKNYLTYI